MTCIVAIAAAGVVHMGADSAGVGGLDLRVRKDVKVFNKDDFVIGCTSSFRMIQLLQYSLVLPKRHPETELHEFMCTYFIDAVRKCFTAGGFAKKDKEEESAGCFLAGVAGRIFRIDYDYQVGENVMPYDAAGCGEAYAIGSLHATASTAIEPKQRLQNALEAAEKFSAGVRGPFVFASFGQAVPA